MNQFLIKKKNTCNYALRKKIEEKAFGKNAYFFTKNHQAKSEISSNQENVKIETNQIALCQKETITGTSFKISNLTYED